MVSQHQLLHFFGSGRYEYCIPKAFNIFQKKRADMKMSLVLACGFLWKYLPLYLPMLLGTLALYSALGLGLLGRYMPYME